MKSTSVGNAGAGLRSLGEKWGRRMTEGFALGFGWLMFFLLLFTLGYFLLRHRP
jgi:hypothetical protein